MFLAIVYCKCGMDKIMLPKIENKCHGLRRCVIMLTQLSKLCLDPDVIQLAIRNTEDFHNDRDDNSTWMFRKTHYHKFNRTVSFSITSYKKTFNNSQFIDLVTAVKGIKLFSNSRKLYLRSTFLLYMTISKLSPRVKAEIAKKQGQAYTLWRIQHSCHG